MFDKMFRIIYISEVYTHLHISFSHVSSCITHMKSGIVSFDKKNVYTCFLSLDVVVESLLNGFLKIVIYVDNQKKN